MARFPRTHSDITALAESMINGLEEHAVEFPNTDPAKIQAGLDNFMQASAQLQDAQSQVAVLAAKKKRAIDSLSNILRSQIKSSEVAVIDNPKKLTMIGWGPKADGVAIEVPPCPTGLRAEFNTSSKYQLQLNWQKSPTDEHRPVTNYIVQRRQMTDSSFGDWELADMTYKNFTGIIGQPKGVQLEYCVIATNAAGNSTPSNTVAVVL